MKKIIFSLWFMVYGLWSSVYAQNETLTLLTYYPAPYGVYQKLDVQSALWDKIDLVTTGSTYETRIGSDNSAMNITANARWTGSAWVRDDTSKPSLAYLQHITNSQHEFRVATADTGNISWITAMVIETDGKVGIGTNTPNSDKLDIETTMNSSSSGVANVPLRIKKDDNTNNEGTGIGFTASTGDSNIGAKIVHERIGTYSRGDLVFYTKPTSGGIGDTTTEKMRIEANGDVGIGANPPRVNLHIFENANQGTYIHIGNSNTGGNATTGVFLSKNDPARGTGAWAGMWGFNSTNELRFLHTENGPMTFYTNFQERMRIQPGGNVDINGGGNIRLNNNRNLMARDSSGTYWNLLGMGSDNNTYLNMGAGNPYTGLRFWNKDTERSLMKLTRQGKLWLYGTTGTDSVVWTPHTLYVYGTAAKTSAGTTWVHESDIRLKKNVQPIKNALEKILQLRGITFQWKEPKKHGNQTDTYMGMVGQDVEKVFPEWVGTDVEGYKTLDLIGFEALTTEAIRELKKENDELRAKNDQLESRIKILEGKSE